eukprot:4011113-Pyramimonas_sp.AAC.1
MQTCADGEVHELRALDRSHVAELNMQGYAATKALLPARREGWIRSRRVPKPCFYGCAKCPH